MTPETNEFSLILRQIGHGALELLQGIKKATPPLHPAGVPFVVGALVLTVLLALWDGDLGVLGLLLTLWVAYFFRNPARMVPERDGLVVSPADGLITAVDMAPLPPELVSVQDDGLDATGDSGLTVPATQPMVPRISIFLNVFDVHVQRVPVGGTVAEVNYRPGKFLNAGLDKASAENERSTTLITMANGQQVAVVQIAGLIARRILNFLNVGDVVQIGQRYGLIRFGSRVDVYLPQATTPLVVVGQRAVGGETILADFASTEILRTGRLD
jgi:phosphatidylserine decarboxylase